MNNGSQQAARIVCHGCSHEFNIALRVENYFFVCFHCSVSGNLAGLLAADADRALESALSVGPPDHEVAKLEAQHEIYLTRIEQEFPHPKSHRESAAQNFEKERR